MEITDAKTNLTDSFRYCASKYASGVQIVFDGKVINGTRAKKTRTKSYNAFSSINYPYTAIIQDGKIMQYDKTGRRGKPKFYRALDKDVGLFKLIPEADPRILDKYLNLTTPLSSRVSERAESRRAKVSAFTTSLRNGAKRAKSS